MNEAGRRAIQRRVDEFTFYRNQQAESLKAAEETVERLRRTVAEHDAEIAALKEALGETVVWACPELID